MALYRIWPATNGPAAGTADATDYTLGVEFYITSAAKLKGYFFWVASDMSTGARSFRLWTVASGGASGTAVPGTDVTSGTLTAGQWNFVPLASPVDLTPNQRYRAGVNVTTASPKYSTTANYWSSGGGSADTVNGPLTAVTRANAEGLLQGSFVAATPITFPNGEFNATNYWIDVQVETAEGPVGGSGLVSFYTEVIK